MMAKKWIISSACALVVMSSGAFSQEDDRPPRREGHQLGERDGDRGPRSDGGRGHRPPPFEDILERHDTNNDGKLQRSEAPDRMPDHIFARLDANDDGAIDAAEAKKAHEMRQGREGDRRGPQGGELRGRGGRHGAEGSEGQKYGGREGGRRGPDGGQYDGRGGRRGPEGQRGPGGRGGGRHLSGVDIFNRMDANGDGVVNLKEAEAFDQKRRERRGTQGDSRGPRNDGKQRNRL